MTSMAGTGIKFLITGRYPDVDAYRYRHGLHLCDVSNADTVNAWTIGAVNPIGIRNSIIQGAVERTTGRTINRITTEQGKI